MAIHRFKPTPRQETAGRAALVVLGILLGGVGIGVCYAVLTADPGTSGRFAATMILLAIFLGLVAIVLILLAFAPGRDAERRQLLGWETASRAFDGFWGVVKQLMRRP